MQQPDAVIVTVLRTGGDFRPQHAEILAQQLREESRGLDLLHVELTDYAEWREQDQSQTIRLPLDGFDSRLPGWWSVLEAFDTPARLHDLGYRVRLDTPYIYMDLDTVCVGDLHPLITEIRRHRGDRIVCIPDICRPARPEMGIMAWRSPLVASQVENRFEEFPPHRIDKHTPVSDWLRARCPDLLVPFDRWAAGVWSYKHDLRDRDKFAARIPVTPPVEPRIVVFHGKPRPWEVGGKEFVVQQIDELTGRAVTDGA